MSDQIRNDTIRTCHDDIEEVFPLRKRRYEIGSHADADIRIPELRFMHAELTFEQGEWVIRRMHPEASIIFDQIDIQMKKLNDGDRIDLNGVSFYFSTRSGGTITDDTTLDDDSSLIGLYTIRVLTGPDKGQEFTLRSSEYLLGRRCSAKGRRIELDDEYLSRDHARLTVTRDYLLIEDLNSQNGLHLGSRRIRREFILPPCTLTAGRTRLRIERISGSSPGTHATVPVGSGIGTRIWRTLRERFGGR